MKFIRVRMYIYGRVQGVSFRNTMKRIAKELRLSGWVRNLPEGQVEAVVEGEEEKVERLVSWSHIGPSRAKVIKVEVMREPYTGEYERFSTRW
jgi:acylphosphatase